MDKFPFEIIDMILHALWEDARVTPGNHRRGKPVVAPYARISRQWQHAVEARLYRAIRIKNTDLDEFANVFANVRLRQYLQNLVFENVEPRFLWADSEDDHSYRWCRAASQQIFRTSVKRLLSILRSWEDTPSDALEMRYSFWLSASHYGGSSSQSHTLVQEPVDETSPDGFHVFKNFATDDDEVFRGRPLIGVSTFTIDGEIHPSAACRLAALFPNVESLSFRIPTLRRNLPEKRDEHRRSFAKGLAAMSGKMPRLTDFEIESTGKSPKNQCFKCQSYLKDEDEGVDPLSEAIRKLAQPTLRILTLRGIEISTDLFRDRRSETEDMWPQLRKLELYSYGLLPDGRWLFTGDPEWSEPNYDVQDAWSEDSVDWAASDDDGEARVATTRNGDRPSHYWRWTIDREALGDFARELTDSVLSGRMPQLQSAYLEVACPGAVSVEYAAEAGVKRAARPGDEAKARSWWLVGNDFDGLEDIIKKWRECVGENGLVEIPKMPEWSTDSEEEEEEEGAVEEVEEAEDEGEEGGGESSEEEKEEEDSVHDSDS